MMSSFTFFIITTSIFMNYVTAADIPGVVSISFNTTVNRLLLDESEDIFVGARNYLHILNPDLTVKLSNRTNIWLDHPDCRPHDKNCPSDRKKVDSDVVGMTFLKIKEYPILITCGTAYQGLCIVMERNYPYVGGYFGGSPNHSHPLNYMGSKRSFYMFTGPGPGPNTLDHVLYVGSEYDGRPFEYAGPTISSRVIKPPNFELVNGSPNSATRIDVNQKFKATNRTRFVYGFAHEKYVYFLQTQTLGSSDVETRLGRICRDDPSFFSYTEISLECQHDDSHYNYATAAYFGPSVNSSPTIGREALSVAFVSTLPKEGETINTTAGSVICSLSLLQLNKHIDSAVHRCFDGAEGSWLLKLFSPDGEAKKCTKALASDQYCGSGTNPYIDGKEPFTEVAYLAYPKDIVTSLAVTAQKSTVFIVGTMAGSVFKAVKSDPKLFEVKFEAIDNDTAIRPEPAFDKNNTYVYVAGGNQVKKIPIRNCSVYTTCGTCLNTPDAITCGWCKTRCSSKEECPASDFSLTTCSPELLDFKPKRGPTLGGTILEIEGSNFGSIAIEGENTNSYIKVAGESCRIKSWANDKIECTTVGTSSAKEGPITITALDNTYSVGKYDISGSATSSENFSFTEPEIYSINPSYGPLAGGTKVTIQGKNLNIGSNQSVFFGNASCQIIKQTETDSIMCLSSPVKPTKNETERNLVVKIDGSTINSDQKYRYLPNPSIDHNSLRHLATTIVGLVNITLTGHHLNSVANPRMRVKIYLGKELVEAESPCSANQAGTFLTCRPPKLPNSKRYKRGVSGYASFLFDGLQDFNESYTFAYEPEPVFKPQVVSVKKEDFSAEISGEHLSTAYSVQVLLKSTDSNKIRRCIIDKQQSNEVKLVCNADFQEDDDLSDDSWKTVVQLGDKQIEIGAVKFADSSTFAKTAGIAFVVFLISFVFFASAAFLLYKRGIYPFVKKIPSYQVAYTAGTSQTSSPFQRQGSQNEYIGTCSNRSANGLQDPLLPSFNSEISMEYLANENILVAREYITLGKILGEGQFGCVYKGSLKLPGKDDATDVAVKTLHSKVGFCRDVDTDSFLTEGLIMKDFKHDNVLTLIGVCFDNDNSPMIILPFMAHGDLLSHIRNENHSFYVKDLLMFAIQIADGMEYLSSLKFVHRDLAARNCMVDEDQTVKVADFGLSRDIYVRDYYRSDQKTKPLPVKWMAIESLERLIYDTKTDVWSYGILLWEIMTRGVTPYPAVDNRDILPFLKAGNRMPMPELCPKLLYDIMMRCWDEDRTKRPTFSELRVEVRNLLRPESDSKQQEIGLNVQYVNYPPSKYYNQSGMEPGPSTSGNPSS